MANLLTEENNKINFARRLQLTSKAYLILAKPTLAHRLKMFKAWASGYYSERKSPYHTINLLGRGVDSVVPFLVEGNPRFMVESRPGNYRRWAYITQLAINYYLDKIKLAEKILIPAATNSMFGAAITRTCLTHSGNIRLEEGGAIKQGTPSVSLIDDSNYIGDPAAKRRADFQIEGDVYRLPTKYAKEFFARVDENGNQIADYIKTDGKLIGEYSPEAIAKENFDRAKLGIKDYTTFIDLFLYDENVIVTIMPEGKKAKILRTVDWKGPEGGPYDYLGYKYLPESTIPLPPAWSWHDLDMTMNILFDKAREQSENQKKILAYESSAEEDAKRVVTTPNMGSVRVDNIDSLKEIDFGGVNPENLQWMQFAESEFTKQGGNPDVMGGRGAQAPTLGQEQMIFSNATRIVRNFAGRFDSFTTSIAKKLAWDFWFNPLSYVPVLREIQGFGQLPAVFSDAEKVGDFYDFTFKITPYSMQRESPETKYQKMMQFVTAWVVPTMAMAAQQGSTLDVPRITRIMAEYLGFENFNQWYRSAIPHELGNVPYQMQPSGPKRTGNKVSKSPGQTNDGFGASDMSRAANSSAQQIRAGGQSSPPQK
jgi:hypothetical protein